MFCRSISFVFVAGERNCRTPERLHLGIDIWGEEGTKVYAPLGGIVHSYGFNNTFGDYGATLILLHQLDTVTFFTLYGHLES
ncbi:MAG: peptidoglycan DD-metalloendopeptidase family protein [Chitinophagaceae bacterium]